MEKEERKKKKENFVGSKRRKWEEKIEILIELALSHWNRNRSGNGGGGLAMARIDLDVTRARVGLSPYGGNSVVGKSLSIEASKSPRLK